jgi:uncharacterized protein YkwD
MERGISRRAARFAACLVSSAVLSAQLIAVQAVPAAAAYDPTTAEQQLYNLINQDRAQNGLAPLTANPTLFSIARGAPQQVCGGGVTFHGRAEDMIERDYFSHQIPPCNSYVWPILQTDGISYISAGENIAWNTYSPQATSVDSANTQFMNSAPHRANILGDYNQVGVGAWAATGPWTDGGGTSYDGVQMYVEIFVKAVVSAPAAPANVVATPANGTVTLSWNAPADGGSPLTGYTVTPSIGGAPSTAISFGPASTSVLIPSLTNGSAYTFTVTASNAVGAGPASAMSNSATPMAAYPFTTATTAQYQLSNSDGSNWVEMDSGNLRLTMTPGAAQAALLTANADLWTAQPGVNQDLGIFVSANGGPDTLVAWKESGGSAGTFSPNAAFVQGTFGMSASVTYTVKLKWKTNIADAGTIFAGAGMPGAFSPTRLTAVLVPSGISTATSRQQYQLPDSDGTTWTDIDGTNLSLSFTPSADGTALVGGNADLWTANAGVNQDLGIFISGGSFGTGRIQAWKESGGFAGTFSPNAAFVQTAIPVTAGTTYHARLQWKTNHAASGATIFAGAGPIGGQFSPTSLVVQTMPAATAPVSAVSTSQYRLAGSNGSSWTDLDGTNLSLTITPSANCLAILGGNADLWTASAGYNQDLAIGVNGTPVAWKESGGFAGTFSPNAAFVQGVQAMSPGSTYVVKLGWKTNKPTTGAAIYAGAGPIGSQFSPTTLSVHLICG